MPRNDEPIEIRSRDYWFKIVEFLQQNWALIDDAPGGRGCTVFFFGDTSGVFDRLSFSSAPLHVTPSVKRHETALLLLILWMEISSQTN